MRLIQWTALGAILALAAATASPADRDIYPAPDQARTDLAAALKTAARTHRRVLLDFGGNWCGDCQVLNIYFHDAQNLPLLQANYVLVDINVGHFDANVALAEQYRIPLKRGVPALAVLDEHGRLLYSQQNGQFNSMERMQSSAVTSFLELWRPQHPGCSTVRIDC